MDNQELADALKAAGIPFQLVGGKPTLVIDGQSAAAVAALPPRVKKTRVAQATYNSPDDKEILQLLKDKKIPYVMEDSGAIVVCGSLEYKGRKLKTLGSIREINGSIDLAADTLISSLGALTKITGNADFCGLPLTSLDNLEEVGGQLSLRGCKSLVDLGVLAKVGSNLLVDNCEALQSIGYNLLKVGASLGLSNSGVTSLGSLTTIGDDLDGCEALTDLGDLTHVEDSANLSGCALLSSLGKLKKCRHLNIDSTSVTTLGVLKACDAVKTHSYRGECKTMLFSLGLWETKMPKKKGQGFRGRAADDDEDDEDADNIEFSLEGWQFNGPVEDLRLIFSAVTSAISTEDASINQLRKPHALVANISRAILEGRVVGKGVPQ